MTRYITKDDIDYRYALYKNGKCTLQVAIPFITAQKLIELEKQILSSITILENRTLEYSVTFNKSNKQFDLKSIRYIVFLEFEGTWELI